MKKEDIENLGFKFIGKSIDLWFEKDVEVDMGSWTGRKVRLHYGLEDSRLFISIFEYTGLLGSKTVGDLLEEKVFNGIIKELNEFKILLKQLNIK